MNINASKIRGREVVRDQGLGVLEECDVCINYIFDIHDMSYSCMLLSTIKGGVSTEHFENIRDYIRNLNFKSTSTCS